MNGSRARYYVVPASKMYNFRMCLQKCVVCFVKMSGFYRDFRMCLRTKLARLCLFNDPCMATSNIGNAKMLCNTSLCFHVYPRLYSFTLSLYYPVFYKQRKYKRKELMTISRDLRRKRSYMTIMTVKSSDVSQSEKKCMP
jgi:hypothetical protein